MAPVSWTTLHLSPSCGSHAELRVAPAPMKSPAVGACPSALRGSQTMGMSLSRGLVPLTPIMQRYVMW
jgi:hypothetical protein